jgi:ubiquinone/menaquinone biosynthesis C-methylase UbiE
LAKEAQMLDENSDRKAKEAEFHDARERDRREMSEEDWLRKYANKKWYSVARAHKKYVAKAFAELAPGAVALDYCCGLGQTSLQLAEAGAFVHGLDISGESVATAESLLRRAGYSDRSTFVVGDAEHTEFEADTFDLIVCNGVLHHLDVGAAFPELRRILKPGGTVLCMEALGYNPIIRAYRRLTPHLRTEWEAEHILTLREVAAARAHFSVVSVKYFYLLSIVAVVLRKSSLFGPVLRVLEKVDSVILRLPYVQRLAWQMVFTLSGPKG